MGADMAVALALIPLAYLAGTFPTAQLVARARGRDVTVEGSGNPGASNVYRLLGAGPAALVFAGDIAKGALPALAGLLAWGHAGGYLLGTAAVVGHVYPATRRFRGGRGVATAGGMAFVVYPLISLGLLVVFLVLSRLFRTASVASLAVAVALPLLVWLTGQAGWEIGAVGALAALVVVRHSSNLRRLLGGAELRLDPRRGDRGRGDRDGGDRGGGDRPEPPEQRGAA